MKTLNSSVGGEELMNHGEVEPRTLIGVHGLVTRTASSTIEPSSICLLVLDNRNTYSKTLMTN